MYQRCMNRGPVMRQYFLIAAILANATPAVAQSYQQYQPQPQQEANVTNYPVPPTTYPQTYAPPAPQPAPQPVYDARPSDAGQSIATDFRQMNF